MWKAITIIGSSALFAVIGLVAGYLGSGLGQEVGPKIMTIFGALFGFIVGCVAVPFSKENGDKKP